MKFLGADEETKSHLHWQFLGIRQSLWRSLLESLHVDTTPIGKDKKNCRKSSAQSKRRYLCGTVAIRSGQKKVRGFCMECYCYLRNTRDLLSDGKTPFERRFGVPFNGPVIPCGAMVEYHTISGKDLSRLHQLVPKVLPGKFLGNVLSAERIWKGDIMVADSEKLEQMDASELHTRELNAKGSVNATGKGRLRYCCNQVWTMNCGRIPWNVAAICETS